MDFPFLLLVLLALPFIAAAAIVTVSSVRRRRHARAGGPVEPVHRAQADTADVQAAAVYPPATGRKVLGGRERRAGEQARPKDG